MSKKPSTKAQVFIAKHPKSAEASKPFEKLYKVVAWAAFPRLTEHTHKVELGPRAERKCAFCGRSETDTKFGQLKHAIPAGLGNRRYFSNEECDDCNQHFGKEAENELLTFLLPQRALNGVKRGPGEQPPKFKSPSGKSYLHTENGTRKFFVGENDPTIRVTHTDDGFDIELEQPPFKPISAIKSLLRSTWMILPEEVRSRHPLLLKIIKDQALLPTHRLLTIAVPGAGYTSTSLIIWESISADSNSPRLLVSLTVGDTILFWGEPDELTLEHLTQIIPPIVGLMSEPVLPTAKEHDWKSNDPVRLTFAYSFNGKKRKVEISETQVPSQFSSEPSPKTDAPGVRVVLAFKTHEGDIRPFTDGVLRAMGRDFYATYFSLEDHELPGFFHHQHPLDSKMHGKPAFGIDFSILAAHKTKEKMIALIESANAGHSLCLLDKASNKQILSLTITATMHSSEDPERENLEYLSLINEEFGLSARLPKKTPDRLAYRLSFLGKGIRHGAWSERIGGKGVEFGFISKEQALEALQKLCEGKAIRISFTASSEFSGCVVETEAVIQISEVFIDEHFIKLENSIRQTPDGSQVKLSFKTGTITFIFPHWYEEEPENEPKTDP